MSTPRPPTLLISDDDPAVVSMLTRRATQLGLEVVSDTTSQQTQFLAQTVQPDAILLDLHQPTDGRDLLAALKRDERTRHLPVFVITGNDDHFLRLQCLDLGAVDVVSKPLDGVLLRRLARALATS